MDQKELAALMQRIEVLEDKVAFLLNHEPAPYTPVSADEKASNEAAVVEMLKQGNMKEAMRLYRSKHEMPFPDMQKAIEELKKQHGL